MDIIPVAIAVVEQENRFLVGKRGTGSPLEGLWEFPGGKVEPHESPQDAAVRECLEETGLQIKVRQLLVRHTHQYPHGQIQLEFYDCVPTTRCPLPRAPFRWVDRSALEELNFPAGNGPVLEILQSGDPEA